MLVEEAKNGLVATNILLLRPGIGKVSSRRHPAMNLVTKGLNMMWNIQFALKLLDNIRWLFLGCKEHIRHSNFVCASGVYHCRMDTSSNGEWVRITRSHKFGDLASPAVLKAISGLA